MNALPAHVGMSRRHRRSRGAAKAGRGRARAGLAGAIGALALVSGCAEQGAMVMSLGGEARAGAAPQVWPAAPELARFAYAGELTGERNFQREGGEVRSNAARFLAFLAGLGLDEETPTVLQRPQGGVSDNRGRIYVTDVSHQAVFVFDAPNARLDVWSLARDGIRFVAPIDVVTGRDDEVLITDAELGAVFRFDLEGKPLGSFGEDVLQRPTGLARDPTRGLTYVADTRGNDIKIFDDEGILVDYIGREGTSPGELNAPTYIAFANDRLYVTDTLNSRIQIFDRDGNVSRIFGERGLYIGNLSRPKGIAVDDDGNIYVVESFYDHLLIFDRQGRFLLPIGGTGSAAGQFYLPAGVWTDELNRVYVADMFNGRVSIFQFLGG